MTRTAMFDALRRFAPEGKFSSPMVLKIDALADDFSLPRVGEAAPAVGDPPWMREAKRHVGTREVVGARHSPVIMGWVRELGASVLGVPVNDDETPWCGTFMALVFKRVGLPPRG